MQYEIDDGQLHITTDNDDWRIIVNGNAKKLFLYHKNKYKKEKRFRVLCPVIILRQSTMVRSANIWNILLGMISSAKKKRNVLSARQIAVRN